MERLALGRRPARARRQALARLPPARGDRPGAAGRSRSADPRRAHERARPAADHRDARATSAHLPASGPMVVTSHILGEIERVADRVAILLGGRLLGLHTLVARRRRQRCSCSACGCRCSRASDVCRPSATAPASSSPRSASWRCANVALVLHDAHFDLTREAVFTPVDAGRDAWSTGSAGTCRLTYFYQAQDQQGRRAKEMVEVLGRRNPRLRVRHDRSRQAADGGRDVRRADLQRRRARDRRPSGPGDEHGRETRSRSGILRVTPRSA